MLQLIKGGGVGGWGRGGGGKGQARLGGGDPPHATSTLPLASQCRPPGDRGSPWTTECSQLCSNSHSGSRTIDTAVPREVKALPQHRLTTLPPPPTPHPQHTHTHTSANGSSASDWQKGWFDSQVSSHHSYSCHIVTHAALTVVIGAATYRKEVEEEVASIAIRGQWGI